MACGRDPRDVSSGRAILRPRMPSSKPLQPAYLIFGSDRVKVRRAVARLRARILAESGSDLNVTVVDVGGAEAEKRAAVRRKEALDETLAALATPSFALGTRLVLVTNGDRWTAKERQTLLDYLRDPMPGTVLAIEGQTFGKDDALVKALGGAKKGNERVLCYDLPKRSELTQWVQRTAAREHGTRIGAAEARHLLALVGQQPERLEREIEKLAAYCRGAVVTTDAIDAVCSPATETRIFDLTDAVGRRDRAAAFRRLEEVFALGEEPQRVLSTLVRHIRNLEAALESGPDVSAADLAKQVGVHPFAARKLLEQRRAYDHAAIGRALKALADADAAMRGRALVSLESQGGVAHGDRFALELALARMLG
ncbi:MAG TPA: DNA polymerase III subunit delta [Thermoleophilia bacterium]|nr:DNA polymerase III subunit delta [Thermoleophilia bacterium]